jgi:hypothetical protein
VKRSKVGARTYGRSSRVWWLQIDLSGKMSWRLAGVALAAAVLAAGRAEAGAIRAEVQAVLRGEAEAAVLGEAEESATPPMCYTILESDWWKERRALNPTVANGQVDQACSVWNQNSFGTRDFCNMRDTRQDALAAQRSIFTSAQWNAACTVRGAHDHSCISNPVRRIRRRGRVILLRALLLSLTWILVSYSATHSSTLHGVEVRIAMQSSNYEVNLRNTIAPEHATSP